ncbi:MAG: TatD family hydrolase [Candidatus ainarchaeum sp.]|nr:TatD family hydrolase [Candidatus ainarchaeum sp.]
MFFDAHLHLDHLKEDEIKKYLELSKKNGLDYFFVNSTSLKSNFQTKELAEKYKEVVPGFGLYPLESTKKDLKEFEKILETQKGKFFIGEIGLDFKFADDAQKKEQNEIFQKVLDLAKEYDVYVNVHSRYAQRQVVEILEKNKQEKVIMHWFCNSEKYLRKVADKEYYINLGPTYLFHDEQKAMIEKIDKNLILFETDYPVEISGKAYASFELKEVINKFCNDFNIQLKELEKMQKKNFKEIVH